MIEVYKTKYIYPNSCGNFVSAGDGIFTNDLKKMFLLGNIEADRIDRYWCDENVIIFKDNDRSYRSLNLMTGVSKTLATGTMEIFFYKNSESIYYSSSTNRAGADYKTTEIYNRKKELVYENSKQYLGGIKAFNSSYYLFSERKASVVDRQSGEVIWQKRINGSKLNYNHIVFFVTYGFDNDGRDYFFAKYDYKTGELISRIAIPSSPYNTVVNGDIVSYIGLSKTDGVLAYFSLNLITEELEVKELGNLGAEAQRSLFANETIDKDGMVYVETKFQDNFVPEQGEDSVRRYNVNSQELKGEIQFPIKYRLMGFSMVNDLYIASCRTREFEHGEPNRLFIWQEEDWEKNNKEINELPSITESQRLLNDDDSSYYKVLVLNKDNGTFDLFCQISASLYQVGAQAGLCLVNDEKKRDKEFNGEIICDLSSLTLSDIEKKAIVPIIEMVAEQLRSDSFRPSIDPAESIVIRPLFGL